MKLSALFFLALVACGGGTKKSDSNPAGGRATTATPSGPAPAECPNVVYACTDPAVGCFEGAADFKAAMGVECKKGGGTEGTKCDRTGTLGSCTVNGKLTPTFDGCGTLVLRASAQLATADDGRAQCVKFSGTWTPTAAP